jgi:hypothetical protein
LLSPFSWSESKPKKSRKRDMRRLFAPLLLLALSLLAVQPAYAQARVDVSNPQVAYRYGEQVNFQATLTASAPISEVTILFRAQGDSSTRSERIPIAEDGQVAYRYTFSQGPLRPFARVDFWFRVTLQTGEQAESAPFFFYYNDDRFPWKTLEDGNIRLHWYAGDDAFAQQALDQARSGLQKVADLLSVTLSHPIDLYIYAIPADLHSALAIGGRTWAVGGEASPDLGVALAAISPGLEQGAEMERKIPHELAHLLTYELVGQRYNRLPVWLREGIASQVEPANPDYAQTLSLAAQQQALIPIADLCGSFPPEASRILLAYAESESFTRSIVNKYGDSGLLRLVNSYADGLDCQQGTVGALGDSLDQLERDWLGSANLATGGVPSAFESLLPYMALLGILLLVPFGLVLATWRTSYGRAR